MTLKTDMRQVALTQNFASLFSAGGGVFYRSAVYPRVAVVFL